MPRIGRLIVATRNRGKLAEIRAALDGGVGELVGLADIHGAPEVEEDGTTLAENASKKARLVQAALGGWVLADDSGLEVDALGGMPGVHSARYASAADRERLDVRFDAGKDVANNSKLLDALAGVPADDRTARFRAVLALADPEGEILTFEGVCPGQLLDAPRGEGGFGYDPLFVPETEWPQRGGAGRTMAELTTDEKNRVSHRGRALAALREWLAS